MAPLGMPCAMSHPCRSQGSLCSPPRLPPSWVIPQEGLHGAVLPQWPRLAGDTGKRRVCCRRFETKCLWGGQRGQGPAAGLCWRGEAVTRWALVPPGQEAPRCWAGWRCLPSVHSLYLSNKAFSSFLGLLGGEGGTRRTRTRLSPTAVGDLRACPMSAPVSGWTQRGQGETGCPSSAPWCHPDPVPLALALPGPFPSTAAIVPLPSSLLTSVGLPPPFSQCSPPEVSACVCPGARQDSPWRWMVLGPPLWPPSPVTVKIVPFYSRRLGRPWDRAPKGGSGN